MKKHARSVPEHFITIDMYEVGLVRFLIQLNTWLGSRITPNDALTTCTKPTHSKILNGCPQINKRFDESIHANHN